MEELIPCPFCKDFSPFTTAMKATRDKYIGTAGCAMCGATIERTADDAEEAVGKAVKAWNTRVKAVE